MPGKGLNLFVANLSVDVNDEVFRAVFSPMGPILSAKVMLDIHTGISRGFGFVLFEKEEDGMKAIVELQGKPLGKRDNPMVITKAQTSANNAITATPKIHLRNIPLDVTEATLHTLLSKCGKIERMVVKEDKSASPPTARSWIPTTLCSFVQFNTPEEAQTAVDKLHNTKPWPDMVVPLMAKLAETPEMRVNRKQRQEGRKVMDTRRTGAPNQAPPVPLPPQPQQLPPGMAPPGSGQPMAPAPQLQYIPHPQFDNSLEYSLTSSFGNSWNFSQQLPPGMFVPQQMAPPPPPPPPAPQFVQRQPMPSPPYHLPPAPQAHMAPQPQQVQMHHEQHQPLVPMMAPVAMPPRTQPQQLGSPPLTSPQPPSGNPSSPLVPALVPAVAVFEQSLEELSNSNHQLSLSPTSGHGLGSGSGMLNLHPTPNPTSPPQYVVVLDPQINQRL